MKTQNRAFAYYNLKKYSPSIKDYTNAIKLTPENKNIYLNRGTIYYKIKNYEKAISDYMKALNSKEKDPSFYHEVYTNCSDKLNKKIVPFVNFK